MGALSFFSAMQRFAERSSQIRQGSQGFISRPGEAVDMDLPSAFPEFSLLRGLVPGYRIGEKISDRSDSRRL
jgi:hypothetical protein